MGEGRFPRALRRAWVLAPRVRARRSMAGMIPSASVHGSQRRILVIEDEPIVAEVVERYLSRDGYEVAVAGDGAEGLRAFQAMQPDLVILDLMLPGIDGLELCRTIRDAGATPVIIVTARDHEADKIQGLAIGADDYVTKPFSPRELSARVEAVLRRATSPLPAGEGAPKSLLRGDIAIDRQARTVTVRGVAVALTAREFDLLEFLASHPARVFTRSQLVEAIWSHDFDGDEGTVTVQVRRLRTKIEADPSRPTHLKTVWGLGYRFDT